MTGETEEPESETKVLREGQTADDELCEKSVVLAFLLNSVAWFVFLKRATITSIGRTEV